MAPPRRYVPPGAEDAVRRAVEIGAPLSSVADEMGFPRQHVYILAREMGIRVGPVRRTERTREVMAMHAQGYGVVAIAGALGITAELANYHLRAGGAQRKQRRHSTTAMAKALQLYADGATLEQIEITTSIPRKTVKIAAQRTGTRRPDRRGPAAPPLAPRREPDAWMNRAMVDYLHAEVERVTEEMARERERLLAERKMWPRALPDDSAGEDEPAEAKPAVDMEVVSEVLLRMLQRSRPA